MPRAKKKGVDHSPAYPLPAARERMLEARIAELEAELRARDDFLAIAAHELRNPMTPIRGRVELLLANARRTPEAVPKAIVQGLERLERLVDAYLRRASVLLDVSRINSDNLSLQPTDTDLSAIVRQAVTSMIPAAERAGSRLRLHLQDGVIGHCDETAMEQILENCRTPFATAAGSPSKLLSLAMARRRGCLCGTKVSEYPKMTRRRFSSGFGALIGTERTEALGLASGSRVSLSRPCEARLSCRATPVPARPLP